MKECHCDNCGGAVSTHHPAVELKGITGSLGGILLPEELMQKEFCKPQCFWEWAKKNLAHGALKG